MARHSLFETDPFEFRIEQYEFYKDKRGKIRKKKLPRRFDEVHILPGAFKCRVCETYDFCISQRCLGRPASRAFQWAARRANYRIEVMPEITDKKLKNDYRDLCMTRDTINGLSLKEVAAVWGCTPRTATIHVKAMASECMRKAMEQTQGDPDHPSTPRFTLEEFTRDPREAMIAILTTLIAQIEEQYPDIQ